MTGRLRLVKVMVQPVLVWDDGESLQEINTQPASIPASEWSKYNLADHVATIAEQVDKELSQRQSV